MPFNPMPPVSVQPYAADAPSRAELDARPGWLLLEFGTDWCPHCQRAQHPVEAVLAASPARPPRLKIEDGPGRVLGRSYRVKLWPTLVLLHEGLEQGRLVRPTSEAEVEALLQPLAAPRAGSVPP